MSTTRTNPLLTLTPRVWVVLLVVLLALILLGAFATV